MSFSTTQFSVLIVVIVTVGLIPTILLLRSETNTCPAPPLPTPAESVSSQPSKPAPEYEYLFEPFDQYKEYNESRNIGLAALDAMQNKTKMCKPIIDDVYGQDPFWNDVAFVIRTGANVIESRYPGGYYSWHSRVPNIIYVSDNETESYTYTWRGRNITIPHVFDGVWKYGHEGDISLTDSAWIRDFVKHLASFQILYEQFPDKLYYAMADDDTYLFLSRIKGMLLENWNPLTEQHVMGVCHPLDWTIPEHSCEGRYPEEGYYPSGGAGIFLTRKMMEDMYNVLDTCYEKYKTCWAGDRRLGACLFDAGSRACDYPNRYLSSDISSELKVEIGYEHFSVHKLSSKQMILLDWVERNADPPGDINDQYLAKFWSWINDNYNW